MEPGRADLASGLVCARAGEMADILAFIRGICAPHPYLDRHLRGLGSRHIRFEGAYGIGLPRDQVWIKLNDPEFLRVVLPGCTRFDQVEPGEFDAQAKVGFGPLSLGLKGKVWLDPKVDQSHYLMRSIASSFLGSAEGEAEVWLSDIPGGTQFRYVAEVGVGKSLAKFGSGVLSGTVDTLSRRFFERVARHMGGELVDLPSGQDDNPPGQIAE